MGKFFWAAHNFRQVKLTQNWPWQAVGRTIMYWNLIVLAPKINTGGSAGVKMSGFIVNFRLVKNQKNAQKKSEKCAKRTQERFFAIFWKQKELLQIHWLQNDQIFGTVS